MSKDEHTSPFPENYEEISIEDTLEDLGSNEEKELNIPEVKIRRKKYGSNTIEEEDQNPLLDFLAHFWGSIPWMLKDQKISADESALSGESLLLNKEEGAGLEILCSDKTGTLIKNELEIRVPVMEKAKDEEELLVSAALTFKEGNQEDDPIDKAVCEGLSNKYLLDDYEIKELQRFNPTKTRAEADVKKGKKTFNVAKGAPQVILDMITLYGCLIAPISWVRAGIVWGYPLMGFFVMSGIKIITIKALVKFGIAETAT